jgi:hypothetical protein
MPRGGHGAEGRSTSPLRLFGGRRRPAADDAAPSDDDGDDSHAVPREPWFAGPRLTGAMPSEDAHASWAEAWAVLDKLEREAVAELQLDLEALLVERQQLLDERAADSRKRWREQLAAGGGAPLPCAGAEHDPIDDALRQNRAALDEMRGAFMRGMPSDERSETAGVMWANAMLRAEVRAGKHALMQLQGQLDELTLAVRDKAWAPRQTAPTLAALSTSAAMLAAEQAAAIERLDGSEGGLVGGDGSGCGGGGVAAADARGVRRFRYLARLVPELSRSSSVAFTAILREARALTGRHRAEREALCTALSVLPVDGTEQLDAERENVPANVSTPAVEPAMRTSSATVDKKARLDEAARAVNAHAQAEEQAPRVTTDESRTHWAEAVAPLVPRRENSLEKLVRNLSGRILGTSRSQPPSPPLPGPTTRAAARKEAASRAAEPGSPSRWFAWGRPPTPPKKPVEAWGDVSQL